MSKIKIGPGIESHIIRLQSAGILPPGKFEYTSREKQFTSIYRVSIDGHVVFFKKLKPRARMSDQSLAEKLNEEYKALSKYESLFSKFKNFNVSKPLYFSSEDLLLVTEEVNGTSLEDISEEYASKGRVSDNNAIDVFTRAGKFLKILHESETYAYTDHDLDELVSYIRDRLLGGIFSKTEETGISVYLQNSRSEIINDIQKYDKNPIHRDFAPHNIISSGEGINVLDFGDCRANHRFQDLAYFKLLLDRQLKNRSKYRQSAKRELIRAFSNGYGCDYDVISNDKLYNLFALKILAIFITTFAHGKKRNLTDLLSVKSIKDNILNSLEYKKTKRKILLITTGGFSE